jgi:hypothetical protein
MRGLIFFPIVGSALAEPLPDPDVIRMQQQSVVRDAARTRTMIAAAEPARLKKYKTPRPAAADRIGNRKLKQACKAFIASGAPTPVFLDTPR